MKSMQCSFCGKDLSGKISYHDYFGSDKRVRFVGCLDCMERVAEMIAKEIKYPMKDD